MSKKITVDEMKQQIKSILPEGAILDEVSYCPEIFGNIVVRMTLNGVSHIFTTDRGEIYHNTEMLCNSSYHCIGKDDTFSKLLEMINMVINE